ncbi:MAG: sialidase family protein [Planctomycetia bacterium]
MLLTGLLFVVLAQAPAQDPVPAPAPAPALIDLAGEKDRQIVVDSEKGQYLGHVSTVTLGDGAILAAYPKGHGRGAIVLKRSDDGGKTWSERLPTPENWATSLETPTLHRVKDPTTGAMRLLCFSGLYPARLATSEDDGRTWTSLQPIGEWGGIVVMGDLVTTSDGRLLAYFHDDGRFAVAGGKLSNEMKLFSTESKDGGKSWGAPRVLHSSSEIHLCEPGIARSPDGREWTMLLRENRRNKGSHALVSADEGTTWSAPRELPRWLNGDRHTARYTPDGRLVIAFRCMDTKSPYQGDFVVWVGTYADLRENKPGEYLVRLADNKRSADCGYPGVEVLKDGTLLLTTYGTWTSGEAPYILAVRLKLEDLAGKSATPR